MKSNTLLYGNLMDIRILLKESEFVCITLEPLANESDATNESQKTLSRAIKLFRLLPKNSDVH